MKLPRASTVVASVFGIGYFDVAPGTIMSAIAVPLAILIAIFGGGGMGVLAASLIAFVLGVLACADHVRETKREDPSECVIDELAGQLLARSLCLRTHGWPAPSACSALAACCRLPISLCSFSRWPLRCSGCSTSGSPGW